MIRRHQINNSVMKPLPKLFAILPATDRRRALEQRLAIRDFVGREMQIMRTSFNTHRQALRLRGAQHVQSVARGQMDDAQPEMKFAAERDHELNREKLRFIRARLQIRRVLAPIRPRQSARCRFHRRGQFRVHEQRQASPRDMRQGCAQLPLIDHNEAINTGMNEEAFESRHARGCQPLDVRLVVAYHSAPRHPIHMALTARGSAFRFERSHCRRRWQTI